MSLFSSSSNFYHNIEDGDIEKQKDHEDSDDNDNPYEYTYCDDIIGLSSYDLADDERDEISDLVDEIIICTESTKNCKYVSIDVIKDYNDPQSGHHIRQIKISIEVEGEISSMGNGYVFSNRLTTWKFDSHETIPNVYVMTFIYVMVRD